MVKNALEFRAPPPLALYVHVPWCVRKCPYCDFNSHALPPRNGRPAAFPEDAEASWRIPEADYVEALIADLEFALPTVWGRALGSVFFGGGTPSLLSGEAVDTLLAAIRARLALLPDAEITLEANPGTVESARFSAYRAAGVNRLSLGVQSFNSAHLQALGRIHDADEARRAVQIAARYFANFNLDLMYGLPGQTLGQALADVEQALAFSPSHLSCYQLTVEAHTAFAASPPPLPEADACADMQEAIETRLAAAGYQHYEISAFARPGHACRHNLNYWTYGDYLGIGAGAHGKLSLPDRVLRQMRWKEPRRYLAQARCATAQGPVQEAFNVAAQDLPLEFMMNALRLTQGFALSLFEARTAQPVAAIEPALRQAVHEGLLEIGAGRVAPTRCGQRFLNRLLEKFVAAPGSMG